MVLESLTVDSDQTTYHFKVESEKEFERWTGLFEKFSHALMRTAADQMSSVDNDLADYSLNGSEMGHSFQASTTMPPINFEAIHDKSAIITKNLQSELQKLKELIEAAKGRVDSRSQWKGDLELTFRFCRHSQWFSRNYCKCHLYHCLFK